MKNKIIIIGAGIHGLTSAISLAENNFDVTVIEKNQDILQGTSRSTHNRAHLGYHYPRSKNTAIECIEGLKCFKEKYPNSLVYPETYYFIEKESQTSFNDYLKFCNELKIPYEIKIPDKKLLNYDHIEGGIKVPEPIFHMNNIHKDLIKKIKHHNINIKTFSKLIDFEESSNGYYLITKEHNKTEKYFTNIIINATYAYSNNILKILDLEEDMTKYYLQHTEIPIMKSKKLLPSMTIMDGKFFSILNYANEDPNLYLLYDVVNSVLENKENIYLEEKTFSSNLNKIIEHGCNYFPFLKKLKYIKSWYGTRPIPIDVKGDARGTRIKSHKKYPGIYSILEGKFISALLIANEITSLIKEENI